MAARAASAVRRAKRLSRLAAVRNLNSSPLKLLRSKSIPLTQGKVSLLLALTELSETFSQCLGGYFLTGAIFMAEEFRFLTKEERFLIDLITRATSLSAPAQLPSHMPHNAVALAALKLAIEVFKVPVAVPIPLSR